MTNAEFHQPTSIELDKAAADHKRALQTATTVAEKLLKYYPLDPDTGQYTLTMTEGLDAPDATQAQETLTEIAFVRAISDSMTDGFHIPRDDLPGVVNDLEIIAFSVDQ